jgi:hypothetical protein
MLDQELAAQTDGGIDRGSLEVAICETIRYLRPHDTCLSVEALREPAVGNEGNRIQLSTALRQAGIWVVNCVQGGWHPPSTLF